MGDETMDNQQAKAMMEMGWLIGFLEGEGSFMLQKQKYSKQKAVLRPRIHMSSTDFELVEKAGEILKSLNVGSYFHRIKHDTRGWKDQMELVVSGIKRCKSLLDQIIPFMTDSRKKKAAETLLSFCELRLSKPHQAVYGIQEYGLGQKLRELNGYHHRQSFRDSTRDVFDHDTKVESALA